MIPDQGGCSAFKNYPKYFGFLTKKIKTDDGIIDLIELKKNIRESSALIVPSFAGYFAEQSMKEIYEICSKNGVLVIEDASGAVGDDILCRSRNTDIIVGSFGNYKPVDIGYGGFLATYTDFLKDSKTSLSLFKVHPNSENEILSKLNENKLRKMLNLAEHVKQDLKNERFKIIHEFKRGINVACEYNPFLLEYCSEKSYPYLVCPNYNRIERKAVSIELKRIE